MGQTLGKAPLVEAMIEVRWALEMIPPYHRPVDRGFDLGVGSFWTTIRDKFPRHTKRGVDRPPEAYRVSHQFRRAEEPEAGPVIQVGPGVLTVSHTNSGYSWANAFLPLFKRTLADLILHYGYPIEIMSVTLRYTDAVLLNSYKAESYPDFLSKNLNVSLVNLFKEPMEVVNLKLDQQFRYGDMNIQLSITSAMQENEPAIIWQTTCTLADENLTPERMEQWLEDAHNKQTEIFVNLCKPTFYASFDPQP